MRISLPISLAALFLTIPAYPALAQGVQDNTEQLRELDRSVAFFAGRLHDGNIGHSFVPGSFEFEDYYLLGVTYDQTFWSQPDGWALGGEVGVATRFGDDAFTGEFWGGLFARYNGFVLGDVRVSPSIIWGLSYVTETIGTEAERAARTSDTAGEMLFYLTPEVAFSLTDTPDWEVFWRA